MNGLCKYMPDKCISQAGPRWAGKQAHANPATAAVISYLADEQNVRRPHAAQEIMFTEEAAAEAAAAAVDDHKNAVTLGGEIDTYDNSSGRDTK